MPVLTAYMVLDVGVIWVGPDGADAHPATVDKSIQHLPNLIADLTLRAEEIDMTQLTRGAISEFIGTFALVFFGAGSIILTHPSIDAGSLITVAMAHALVLTVFVTACLYVSGAQFNPAVSIALIVAGKQDAKTAVVYIFAQLVAAASAAGMLVLLIGPDIARHESVRLGATLGALTTGKTVDGVEVIAPNLLAVFALEVLQTFALMFVILAAVADERAQKLGGFCVGLVVGTCILAFGPLTGSSMNPARSFGPALYGNWDMHWVYWVAPITGACLASLAYKVWDAPPPAASSD